MFGDIIHKIRNGLDDIGSFITGQPAHGPANPPTPSTPKLPQIQSPQQFQNPGQVRLGPPTSTLPGISPSPQGSTLPQIPKFNPQGQFVNPNANKFAQDLTSGAFKSPQQNTPQPPANATTVYHDANGNVTGWEDPNTHQSVQVAPNNPVPQPHASILHDITHNPITNFAGGAVKFIPQFSEDWANTWANVGNRLAGAPDQTIQQNMGTDPIDRGILKMSGATGQNRQLAADVVQTGIAAAAPIAGKIAEPIATGIAGAVAPDAASESVNLARLGLNQVQRPIDTGIRYGTNALESGLVNAGFSASQTAGQKGATPLDVAKSLAPGFGGGVAFGAAGTGAADLFKAAAPAISNVVQSATDATSTNAPRAAIALHNALHQLPDDVRVATVQNAGIDKPTVNLPANNLIGADTSGEGTLDPERVAAWQQHIASGNPVPPLFVMKGNDGGLYVEDGKNRLAAMQNLGMRNVPTKILSPEDIKRVADSYAPEPVAESLNDAATGKAMASDGSAAENLDELPKAQGLNSASTRAEEVSPESQGRMPEQISQPKIGQLEAETTPNLQTVADTTETYPDNTLVKPDNTATKLTPQKNQNVRLAAPSERGRIGTFLNRVNQREPYSGNLENDVKKLLGHYQANRGALRDVLKANKSFSKPDLEAVYHHAEDSTTRLTPKQQEIFDKYYAPLRQTEAEATSELSDKPVEANGNYIHRVAQNKGSNLEGYFSGRRQSPEEGVNRKTVDSQKAQKMLAITDKDGNRTVVSIASPKDELGKVKGAKRVTAFRNGEREDLGSFKTKTNQELLDKELKPAQAKLNSIAKEVRTLQSVRTRGGVSEARLNNLAKKAGELQYIRDEEGGLTGAEARSLRNATLKFKELARVKPTKTNAGSRLETLSRHASDLLNKVNDITDKYDPDKLEGKVFVDKNGNRYTIGRATTKEIEANSGVRYYKEPLLNTALNIVNTKNAIAAKEFMENWQRSPDFAEHAMKADSGHIPEDWKSVNAPAFRGYYFDPQTVKVLDNYFSQSSHEEGAFAKAWNGTTNLATQAIVINPEVHGMNLYFQAMIASGKAGDKSFISRALGGPVRALKFNAALAKVMFNPESRAQLLDDYLRNGGHFMSYGKDSETIVSRALQKSHLPGVNKLNAQAMSGIDATIRAALWDSSKDDYKNPEDAINNIDKFMGEKGGADEAAHNIILFYHWLKTEGKAIGSQTRHPIQNVGANVNTGLLFLAVTYGVNSVWQKMTGNKYAHVRYPGELGLIHDVASIPGDLKNGNVAGAANIVTSHLNPILSTGANQLYGQDLFTGRKLNNAKARAGELIQNMFAPAQNISKVSDGKSTPLEQFANEMGFYTPHVKGTEAAPRFGANSPFNVPGSTPNTDQAYAATQQYYNNLNKLTQSLAGPNQTQDAAIAQSFISRDRTPQGQTQELAQGQTEANWKSVSQNLPVLLALQKFYQGSGSHNPEWDLGGNGTVNGQAVPKIQLWAVYKSLAPGDLQKDAIAQENPWINQTENAVTTWAAQQNFSGNTVQSPNYVPYPNIPQNVQNMMTQITQLSSIPPGQRTADQINQLSSLENNSDVQNAFQQLDAYTNAVRAKENLPEVQYAPNVPPAVQDFENQYMGASKTERTALRTQYPGMYNQMQQAMEQQSLASAEKYGGEGYYGAQLPDSYLSDLYSLGNYDIAKIPNANGTNSYALDNFTGGITSPNGLPTATGTAVSSSSSKSSGSSSQRTLIHSLKYGSRLKDVRIPKKPYVHSTAVHNRQIRIGGGSSIIPKGHYTGLATIKKGSKPIKNIRVAGVKQYKPAA